jgi:hypothetical protein
MWLDAEKQCLYLQKNDFTVMLTAFIILSVISLLIVVVAVVIMLGRGDDFIVGYNIASKKTRDMYDIRRVRVIVGVLLMLIAMALPAIAAMLIMGYKELVMTTLPAIVFVLIAATFTASHLWAKKKSK